LTEQIQIQFFTELQSQKHSTVESQVRVKSVLFGVRINNSLLFPFNCCFSVVHTVVNTV